MKQHPIYDHLHITEDGKVYSFKSKKFLKTLINKGGYEVFHTKLNGRLGKGKLLRVHRLVADTYIPNPECKPQVNHIDGDKQNNHFSNLEWCTNKENTIHSWKIGLQIPRERDNCTQTKIKTSEIPKIKEMLTQMSMRKVAKEYGVSHQTIMRVLVPRI